MLRGGIGVGVGVGEGGADCNLSSVDPVKISLEDVDVDFLESDSAALVVEPLFAACGFEVGGVRDQETLRDCEIGVLGLVFVYDDEDFFGEVGEAGGWLV